jgi:hypothetical protein
MLKNRSNLLVYFLLFGMYMLQFGHPYPTLPYPTLPYPTLPYPTLPWATLPYPTLGYPKEEVIVNNPILFDASLQEFNIFQI